jgi:hypothetical protein
VKKIATILLLASARFLAHGASFISSPAADAFVTAGPSGNLSGNNYGAGGSIAVSAAGLPQGELQSALQFNLGGALSSFNSTYGAGQWTIQSASLQLTATAANNGVFNTSAAGQFGISLMQNDLPTEGTGTPAAPTTSGLTFASLQGLISGGDQNLGTFGFNGATSGAFTYALGLTPGLIADALAGGNLSLRLFATDTTMSGVFNSKNFGTASSRPQLTLVAVPEPGVMTLSAMGLAMLTGWKLFAGRKKC